MKYWMAVYVDGEFAPVVIKASKSQAKRYFTQVKADEYWETEVIDLNQRSK